MDRIKDWKIPIIQTILPIVLAVVLYVFPIQKKIKNWMSEYSIPWNYQIIIDLGKGAFILFVFILLLHTIRKTNSENTLKQNLPNKSVWHSMVGYWFCRYILNYKTVSLIRVPIPVQFKLVWKDWFSKYDYEEGLIRKDGMNYSVYYYNKDPFTSTINLVISDTYPIKWEEAIPKGLQSLTTIIIERECDKGVRYYSTNLISKVSKVKAEFPNQVNTVNVFATVNPAHSFYLARDVFKTGGRDHIDNIYVFQQSEKNWEFIDKIKIF